MERILGQPFVYSINIKPYDGKRGIPKIPIDSARITTTGIFGDYNRFRDERNRNQPSTPNNDFALLLLPYEVVLDLRKEGWSSLEAGHLGENITTRGISYETFSSGQRYQLGERVLMELTQEAHPCSNLKVLPYVGEERKAEFIKTLVGRRGYYAKVLGEGFLRKGENIYRLE